MCHSSYHLVSLASYREFVAAEIFADDRGLLGDEAVCRFDDVHIASSCLQKALRRGDHRYALDAGLYLLRHDEERLWRRLSVCAFEDFGLVDLGLTARIVATAASRNFRLNLGQPRVLNYLVARLSAAAKDRRLDEIYAIAAAIHSDHNGLRAIEAGRLGSILAPLAHEAARLIAGCERSVPRRSFRAIAIDGCERALRDFARRDLVDTGLYELCLAGVRASKCLLPVLLPLAIAATEEAGGLGHPLTTQLAPVPLIGGVPAYAIDGFTRAGRTALEAFRKSEPRIASLLAPVPARERFDALHHLVFYAEGGLIAPAVSDPLYDAAKARAMEFGMRGSHETVSHMLSVMHETLPILHAVRAAVIARLSPGTKEENM